MAQWIPLRLDWRRLAPAFLLLLVVLYFWPFFLHGEVIAPADLLLDFPPWSSLAPDDLHVKNTLRSDVLDATLPRFSEFKDGISDGDVPLWSPLKAQGRPLASLLQSSVFHPLALFFILLFPLAEGFSLLIMAKLGLSGFFMYLFLRRLDVSRAGSLLGGVAYMFSGFNIVWLMWPHTLVSSFAPLLFLQIENLVRGPRPGNVALLAVVVAIMVLGGFLSVAGYFFYAAGLYFLVRVAQTLARSRDWTRALWTGGAFGLGFALGAGITALQLLPTLEHVDFIDIGYRESLSLAGLPVKQGIQLAFPNFYGNQVFGNYQGAGNLNETSGYVGIITLILALWGFGMGLVTRRGLAVFFGALALLSFLIVYDVGPFLGLVRRFPVFDLNSNSRLLAVLGLAMAVVAGFGFDELRGLRPTGWLRPAALLAVGIAGVAVAGMLAYLGYEIIQRRELLADFLHNFPSMEFHTFRLITVAFGIALVMVFVAMIFLRLRQALSTATLAVIVLLLISSDLLVFAYRQNPTVPDEYFYPETPAIKFLKDEMRPYERMAPFDGTFMIPGTQAIYGFNSSFSHALHTQRQRDLIQVFSRGAFVTPTAQIPRSKATDFFSPLIDLLGIRFITVPYDVDLFQMDQGLEERYDLVYANQGELKIYENKRFSAAFLASDVMLVKDEEDVLAMMERSEFNPREVAIIEEALPPEWTAAPGARKDTVSSVTVTGYGRETVAYEVEASQPALLVIPELYHPGWEVSVDGEPARLYRADYIFRGVFVDEGLHEVKFTYRPASFRNGLIITAVALFSVAGLVALDVAWRRLRRARGEV